ncbi:MAG: TetR family transcriptional regulator [Candidatus Latescibacterota bacterium]|jgi:TetR/AcrR family fatty acid metabolism transcriptional regulator
MTTVTGPVEEAPTRREREKAAHRSEILQAAVKVFSRKGFAAATIEEIAQEAEFSKGAVYLHFASKEELLSTVLLDMIETAVTEIRQVLPGTRSLREELSELYRQAAEFAFSHRLHMSTSMPQHLCQFGSLSEETQTRMAESHQQMVEILRHRIGQAQQAGEVRAASLDAVVGLVHGALDSMVATRWGRETVEELQVAAAEVIKIIFDGIAQRKE